MELFLQTLTRLSIYGVNSNEGAANVLCIQKIFVNLEKYCKRNGERFHMKLIINLQKACHIELKHALRAKDCLLNTKYCIYIIHIVNQINKIFFQLTGYFSEGSVYGITPYLLQTLRFVYYLIWVFHKQKGRFTKIYKKAHLTEIIFFFLYTMILFSVIYLPDIFYIFHIFSIRRILQCFCNIYQHIQHTPFFNFHNMSRFLLSRFLLLSSRL